MGLYQPRDLLDRTQWCFYDVESVIVLSFCVKLGSMYFWLIVKLRTMRVRHDASAARDEHDAGHREYNASRTQAYVVLV